MAKRPGLWYLAECGDFFRECRRTFRTTGSILPSSPFLARALVAQLRSPRAPGRILEVGPGTGSVTREMLPHLMPGDRLDAVEINSHFVKRLRYRVRHDAAFRNYRKQVRIVHSAVEELEGYGDYDYIVSGLPLNNFPVSQVRTIFRAYNRLLRPGGTLTYYEYSLIRQLKSPFVSKSERRRLQRVGMVTGRYIRAYQFDRERILINVPPATVRHLCFQPELLFATSHAHA